MAIYITGDVHGDEKRFETESIIGRTLKDGDILLVAGDFGIPSNPGYQESLLLRQITQKPYRICFVDGNHENFDMLEKEFELVENWNGGKVHVLRRNLESGLPKIIHLMRGQVYEIDGKKIFTFGGGCSLDRAFRIEGRNWWAREMPNESEYQEGIKNLKRVGNKVDYIITHTAPLETISGMRLSKRLEPKEQPLNTYLEYIRETITYERWYFGHFHENLDLWRNQVVLYEQLRELTTNKIIE